MQTVTRLIVEHNEKMLVLQDADTGQWMLPSHPVSGDRFEAVADTASQLDIDPGDVTDLVRLEIETDGVTDNYLMHTTAQSRGLTRPDGVSDHRWVRPPAALGLDWRRMHSFFIVPIRYLDDYLSTPVDYDSGRHISVVKTLIRNEDGAFLATKKSHLEKVSSGERFKKYGQMSGKWELPGGRIGKVPGEDTRFQAAQREIKEEIGLTLDNGTDVLRELSEQKNRVDAYIVLYDAGDWHGDIQLSEEHTDYRWMTPDTYLRCDWHKDAGYGYPPMRFLDYYLQHTPSY